MKKVKSLGFKMGDKEAFKTLTNPIFQKALLNMGHRSRTRFNELISKLITQRGCVRHDVDYARTYSAEEFDYDFKILHQFATLLDCSRPNQLQTFFTSGFLLDSAILISAFSSNTRKLLQRCLIAKSSSNIQNRETNSAFYNYPAQIQDIIHQNKMEIESLCFPWQVVDFLQPYFRHFKCKQCRVVINQ